MTEAWSDWDEERHFRRDAVRGSKKLLRAIQIAQKRALPRPPRKRAYLPRSDGRTISPTVLRYQRIVANYYGLKEGHLFKKSRERRYAHPRQVTMYLARTLAGLSFPKIARHFKFDHTTVLHACRSVPLDPDLSTQAEELSKIIASIPVDIGDAMPNTATSPMRNSHENAIEHSGNTQEERLAA